MANQPTIYIETTIPSFLTARPSGDLIVAGVRKARAEVLAEYNGAVHKMLGAFMKQQWKSGPPVVSCPGKNADVKDETVHVAEGGAGYTAASDVEKGNAQ